MKFYRHTTAVALVLAMSGGMIAATAPASAQNTQNAEECLAKLRQIEQNVEQANLTEEEQREFDRMREEAQELSRQGNMERCQVVVSRAEEYITAESGEDRAAIVVQRTQPEVTVRQPQPQVSVLQPEPRITVQQAQPEVSVTQAKPQVTVRVPEPQVTVRMPKPEVTIRQGEPEVSVTQAEPQVTVEQAEPEVAVNQQKPQVSVQMDNPNVNVQQAQPEVQFDQPEPRVIVQKQEPEVQVEQQRATVQVERSEPEVRLQQAEPEVAVRQQEPEVQIQQGEPQVNVEQQQADVNVQQQEPRVNIEQQARQSGETGGEEAPPQGTAADQGTLQVGRASERTDTGQREGAALDTNNPLFSMSSEELIGTNVHGATGDQIGDIEHVLLGQDNQVYGVVSVGGFLGIGDHDVALPIGQFQQQGDRLVLSSETEDSLKSMPDYDEGAAGYQPLERDRRPIDYMR